MTSQPKIKVALVGVGYWGPNVARSLVSTGKADLTWLCNLNKEDLTKAARRHSGVKTTTDMNDLLADNELDAIAISTPTNTHFSLAQKVLEAGKHVLVEKPLTTSKKESQILTQIAKERGLVLMVGHVFQYNEGLKKLKEMIAEGELGDIYYLSFERTNLGPVRTDVSALWDLATHDISIICDLIGRSPQAVSATGKSFLNPGVEDVIFATFDFKDGPQAHVHASWLNPRKVREITIVGSKKMVIWDDLEMRAPLKVIDKHVDFPAFSTIGDSFMDFKTACVDGGVTILQVQNNPPLQNECEHFLDCIVNKTTPLTDGRNGAQVVGILEAATKSLKLGGAYVPCDEDI